MTFVLSHMVAPVSYEHDTRAACELSLMV